MDIQVICNQLLILFLYMLLGVVLNKVHIINSDFNQRLTKIIINVTMPFLILASVLKQEGERDTAALGAVALVAVVTYIALPVLSYLLVRLFRVRPERQGLYMFMTIYSNVGFMGFPVLNALYGSKAVVYAAIFNIIFNLSIYTYGVIVMHYKRGGAKEALQLRSLLSPGISLSLVAILVYIFRIPFPAPLTDALSAIGDMTVPLAMIVIGATLGSMKLKELFDDWKLFPYVIFRQFLLPLCMFPLLRLFLHDEMILGISFILLMMPVANTAVLFANLYDNDDKLAAKAVFFTTLSCIVTIPALVYICL